MRKGITPVVAMVLLLMMTLAAAGAAFVWTQGLIDSQQQEGQQQLETELTVRDARCYGGSDLLEVELHNTGSVAVDASSTDIFVNTLGGDNVGVAENEDYGTINPDDIQTVNVTGDSWNPAPGFSNQTSYDIDFEFVDQEWSYTCTAG